ncbi:hypothetical protein C8Q79DRAFT_905677 [Trametes meyenii]|nr:hypothetical protein C8Q79DRAFT_905677 [Trametes meyenii]
MVSESPLDRLLASTDVSDSSDFPDNTEAPGLRTIDEALRCDICRDFYDAPVSLTCGHSFCSVCIRSALPISATCPSCRKPASEVHIRRNVVVENAVQAWKTARPLILRVALEEHARKTHPPPPRNSRTHSDGPSRKRKRSGSPLTTHTSEDEVIMVPSSPATSGSATPDALPDTVECPICQKPVHSQKINMHIDSGCKRHLLEASSGAGSSDPKGKQKQQWSLLLNKATGGPTKAKDKGKGKSRYVYDVPEDDMEPEHLPKVAYDIHPQRRIADMLVEWGLPTHGDKNALVRRHGRWIVLYNANVDRAPENRKTVEQLRLELRRAEEAEGRTRKGTVDDPIAYQKANRSTFAKLTEAARPKKLVPKREDRQQVAAEDQRPTPVPGDSTMGGQATNVIDVDAS